MVKPRNEWNQTTKTKQNEWRKKNRALLGADMPKQEADQFRTLCKSSGVSVSAALSHYVRAAIQAGTLDIIRRDIPRTTDDDGTTAAGSCMDDDDRRENADQQNDTPGTVSNPENASD